MRYPDALTPLADRRFAWYYTARFATLVGGVMVNIALPFAVRDITGNSASALGQVLAAHSVPMVLFMLIGGVVADRFSRSTVMQVSNLLGAITQGVVAVLLITGTAELWMLIVLEAVNGIVTAFAFPAMYAIVPQLVAKTHLQQANALLAFSRNAMMILGPTLAALLVVVAGSGWTLAIDALMLLLASYCMWRVKIPRRAAQPETSPSMVRELAEGWQEFHSRTWVWVIVLAFGVLNAIHSGAWFTLGPAVARTTDLGEQGWGLALSAEAVGLLLTTVVLLKVKQRRPSSPG